MNPHFNIRHDRRLGKWILEDLFNEISVHFDEMDEAYAAALRFTKAQRTER